MEQAAVPLLRACGLTNTVNLDKAHSGMSVFEEVRRPNYQGGLTHLSGIENVAQFMALECFPEEHVCLTWQIAGSIKRDRASSDKKLAPRIGTHLLIVALYRDDVEQAQSV